MTIVVYTTPDCVQCESTKRMLDKHNVPYDVVDLTKNSTSLEMVRELGYTSAPVVMADGKHWSGFRIEKLKNLIAEHDLSKGHTSDVQ